MKKMSTSFPVRKSFRKLSLRPLPGQQSLETICLLMCYKMKYPENFFLLRGNHECASLNRVYGRGILYMLVVEQAATDVVLVWSGSIHSSRKVQYHIFFYQSFSFSSLPRILRRMQTAIQRQAVEDVL